MSNPYEGRGLSVTLKSDGKDGTWMVFHGTVDTIREELIAAFGLGAEEAEAPFYDLVHHVTRVYKATGNVSRGLGGRVIDSGTNASAPASSAGSAWEKVASEPQLSPEEQLHQQLLEKVEAAPHVKGLKEIWAKNQAAFDNDELMTAYRTKGKALKEAGLLE